MKHIYYLLAATLSIAGLLGSPIIQAHAAEMPISEFAIDAKSGHVYKNQDASTVRPVASISKLFTIYLALQKIEHGQLSLSSTVIAPQDIATLSQNNNLANVPLEAGQRYTVRDLLYASLVHSANSAVLLLAQTMYGNQDKAVKEINLQAKIWHLKGFQLVNVTGLNNQLLGNLRVKNTAFNAENELSAKDVATVARKVLNKYGRQVLSISSEPRMNFNLSQDFPTENRMLPTQADHFQDTPVDGLKTGSSDAAGNCFVGTAQNHGHRIITVVLGATYQNKDQVFQITHKLFNDAFAQIQQTH